MLRPEKWGIAEIGFILPVDKAEIYLSEDPDIPLEVLEAIQNGDIKTVEIWSRLKEIKMA